MTSKIMNILKELLNPGIQGTFEPNEIGKQRLGIAHSQLLSLIRSCVPKKKYPAESDMGPSQIEIEVCDIWNSACDEMEKNMENL